jgi:hypothetical protein
MKTYTTTRAQREAMFKLYIGNPDGTESYREFRKRFKFGLFGDYIGGAYCKMYVGIEPDGYTHT